MSSEAELDAFIVAEVGQHLNFYLSHERVASLSSVEDLVCPSCGAHLYSVKGVLREAAQHCLNGDPISLSETVCCNNKDCDRTFAMNVAVVPLPPGGY